MEQGYPELDPIQQNYRAAVDAWVAAIRHEESLASVDHSVAQVDQWENAAFQQHDAGEKARAAKAEYEAALRAKFFNI